MQVELMMLKFEQILFKSFFQTSQVSPHVHASSAVLQLRCSPAHIARFVYLIWKDVQYLVLVSCSLYEQFMGRYCCDVAEMFIDNFNDIFFWN